ncbi:hypothetical protein BGY98DRAFT_984578, partial [Russula aff. rugulosa BPL654]
MATDYIHLNFGHTPLCLFFFIGPYDHKLFFSSLSFFAFTYCTAHEVVLIPRVCFQYTRPTFLSLSCNYSTINTLDKYCI